MYLGIYIYIYLFFIVFCSHKEAFRFFEERIYNDVAYPAVKCDSYFRYNLNLCQNGDIVYMGNPTPPRYYIISLSIHYYTFFVLN